MALGHCCHGHHSKDLPCMEAYLMQMMQASRHAMRTLKPSTKTQVMCIWYRYVCTLVSNQCKLCCCCYRQLYIVMSYVCMDVYMHVCMCTCVYVCMCGCMYVCMRMSVHVHVLVCVHVQYMCMCVCIRACVCV